MKILWLCKQNLNENTLKKIKEKHGDYELIHYKDILPKRCIKCIEKISNEHEIRNTAFHIATNVFINKIDIIFMGIDSPPLIWEIAQEVERLSCYYGYDPICIFLDKRFLYL